MATKAQPGTPETAPSGSRSIFNRDFLLAGGVAFSFFMVNFSYFSTLPLYIKARGGMEADVSLVVGAGGLMSLLSRPFVGWLVDGLGRRRMLMAGTLLALLSSVSYAVAVSLPLIVFSRMLGGAALSFVQTAATTLINDAVPPGRRGEANGYFGMAVNVATGLGPPWGAFIVAAAFLVPGEQALSAFVPSVSEAGNYTLLFLNGVAMAALGTVLAYLVHDRFQAKGIHGLPNLARMFRREAIVPALLYFSGSVPFAAVLSLVPIYARDHGLGNPGLFFTVYSGMIFLMRIVSGRATDRFGRAVVFVPGLAMVGAAMLLMSVFAAPWLLLLCAALYGAGQGLAQPALTAYTADVAPAEARGAAMSTYSLGFDLALSVGAWGLGAVVAGAGVQAAFLAAGASPFAGIAFYALWSRRRRPVLAAA